MATRPIPERDLGATGAQGRAVIDALLAPAGDGSASPYSMRALTRDPTSKYALQLSEKFKGVEFQGTFDDFDTVAAAFVGVYGAWTNKDGFTVGEMKEIYFGMRIFEIAKESLSMRHYVWSNLPYPTKDTGFNPEYKVGQMDGKATMGEWPQAQPFNDSLSWSQLTTGPYMDMLQGTFDHRAETSARDLSVSPESIGWDRLVETSARVTGQRAVFKRQTIDEWRTNFDARIENF
ncbi:hypothetical protein B0H10DRAFT_2341249 [Mycena sp. CBHHK59/15]|nr:hypothetical protein B0H10DRAFT_2341249 [Mycena sp. CBHHK59/15]